MWLGRGKGWRPANCYRSSVYYKQHYGRREYEDHMGCGWMLPLSIMPPETQGLGMAVASRVYETKIVDTINRQSTV